MLKRSCRVRRKKLFAKLNIRVYYIKFAPLLQARAVFPLINDPPLKRGALKSSRKLAGELTN